jgi:ribosomal protein S27AE
MILEIAVRWKCDRCGYKRWENYGDEDTNNPTIRQLPAGWDYYGKKRKKTDCKKIHCDMCA